MGQNNDTTEHGDKQGQQGGQMDKENQQDQQQQAQKGGQRDDTAGSDNKDKSANQSGDNNKQ